MHDVACWREWLEGHVFDSRLTVDGSCAPCRPFARGLSGASATLWRFSSLSGWDPVASMLASCTWSTAVEAESTATQLALYLLCFPRHISMHALVSALDDVWMAPEAFVCIAHEFVAVDTLTEMANVPARHV